MTEPSTNPWIVIKRVIGTLILPVIATSSVDGNKHFKIANVFCVPTAAFPDQFNSLKLCNALNLIGSEWASGFFGCMHRPFYFRPDKLSWWPAVWFLPYADPRDPQAFLVSFYKRMVTPRHLTKIYPWGDFAARGTRGKVKVSQSDLESG
ncbi:uncharacterized protein LACBIDRAFT_295381 [Laccaria bicolor S238N-H82]|uniref:Predicted protein n=1 Tax=Laccaria bicolor (strain S238N-H82 / ATCC MYA-4686) TaxID=486041 RepID=B0DRN4_LACBS|nr:uncharacterized protein LACBIDRAFT_295381 [Laccaria bicolor S238N-H82]EDR02816.1 predicted protein [Laccaria bicolor S238N-H82]|eukprot:XP_001886526.1 predicted protein [Laccaria bicolor S238N-H82]